MLRICKFLMSTATGLCLDHANIFRIQKGYCENNVLRSFKYLKKWGPLFFAEKICRHSHCFLHLRKTIASCLGSGEVWCVMQAILTWRLCSFTESFMIWSPSSAFCRYLYISDRLLKIRFIMCLAQFLMKGPFPSWCWQ